MNIDRYTKSVLTIIAVCQCIMVFRETPIIKDAIAQNLDPIHVTVDSVRNSALRDAGPIEVRCIAGCKQFSGGYTDIDTYLFPGFPRSLALRRVMEGGEITRTFLCEHV